VTPFCDFHPVDVVFVLDSSGSVTESNFNLAQLFVADMIELLDVGEFKVRVAATLFDSRPRPQFDFDFSYDKATLQNEVLNFFYDTATLHGTATGAGLDYVTNNILTSSAGYRGGDALVFVITDGVSQESSSTVQTAADNLKATGAHVVAVGISSQVSLSQLHVIASTRDDVIYRDSYRLLDPALGADLVSRSCNVPSTTALETTPATTTTTTSTRPTTTTTTTTTRPTTTTTTRRTTTRTSTSTSTSTSTTSDQCPVSEEGCASLPLVTLAYTAPRAHHIQVGDVTGEGIPDFIIASTGDNTVRFHTLLDTAGTVVTSLPGGDPRGLALGDFNGDDLLDIATVWQGAATVTISLNNGDGTFSTSVIDSGLNKPFQAAAADLNGDGVDDVVVTDRLLDGVFFYLGVGDGTFGSRTPLLLLAGGAYSVEIADFNGDGRPDVVVGLRSTGDIAIAYNVDAPSTAAGIAFNPTFINAACPDVRSVAVADLDLNGELDVIAACTSDAQVSIYLSSAGRTVYTKYDISDISLGQPFAVDTADINLDGYDDIILADRLSGDVIVFSNTLGSTPPATGSFVSRVVDDTIANTRDVVVADVDLDGDMDILAASFDDDVVDLILNVCCGN
jgi:hypothetical protein